MTSPKEPEREQPKVETGLPEHLVGGVFHALALHRLHTGTHQDDLVLQKLGEAAKYNASKGQPRQTGQY